MIDVTVFAKSLHGKAVSVLGLGISNMAVIHALRAAGVEVWAWDDQEMRREDAKEAGAKIRNPVESDWSHIACLVLSPGVPLHYPEPHPAVIKAREAGREIICDLEILHRCHHNCKTIGITGTNGKSTTTALVGHILAQAGRGVAIGGNIGKAALELDMPPEGGVFVLELSSFQLDLCPTFRPDIAVHLNLSPDHIDRHGSVENYADAKGRIFEGLGKGVIGVDDKWSERLYERVKEKGPRKAYPISGEKRLSEGVCVVDDKLYDKIDRHEHEEDEGSQEPINWPFNIRTLPGTHNAQNAAAAYAACRLAGLDGATVFTGMESFPGLQHRQFLTAVINGVAYVNDSKATNAAATARALASYRNIYWIVGGRGKEGGLKGVEPYLDRVRHAFLIGEAMDEFGTWLDNHGVARSFSGSLESAVSSAHEMAQGARGQPGGTGTVLLSPACASYDQFKDFAERGECFTTRVKEIENKAAET